MVDEIVKLITALAALLNAVVWPAVVGWLIYKFSPVLRDFLAEISEGSVKGWGIEASAKRERATQAIARAESKSENPKLDHNLILSVGSGKSYRIAELITRVIPAGSLEGRTVLWVDDKPENNLSEQQAFQEYGLSITIATSTEEALEILRTNAFDVIISDLEREKDQTAGFALLEELRKRDCKTPVIFYTSTNGLSLESEAMSRGAFGLTNQAFDLLLLVNAALNPGPPRPISRVWKSTQGHGPSGLKR